MMKLMFSLGICRMHVKEKDNQMTVLEELATTNNMGQFYSAMSAPKITHKVVLCGMEFDQIKKAPNRWQRFWLKHILGITIKDVN